MKTSTRIPLLTCLAIVVLLMALPLSAMAQGRRGGYVRWSGTVDDTVIITIHGSDVNTQVVKGKNSGDINAQVVGHLPARPVRVFITQRQGRGVIRVVEQPNPGNNFTARIRVRDPQPGSSFYRFVALWRPRGGPGRPGPF